MAELAAKDDHGCVDLRPQVDHGSAGALAVISARAHAASELAAWRRRSWQLVKLETAAAWSSCSWGHPSSNASAAARAEAGGPRESSSAGEEGPPAAGRGGGAPLPSAGGSSCHMEKLGAFAPVLFGRGRSKSLINLAHACRARADRRSPFHWAGSFWPEGRKPGHDPQRAM